MQKIVVVLLMGFAIISCNDTPINKKFVNTDDIRKSILSSIEIYRYATRLDYVIGENERALNRLSVQDFELSIMEAGVEKYGQVFRDDFKSVKEADVTKRLYSTVEVVNGNNSRRNQLIDTTYPEQYIANYFAIVQPTTIVQTEMTGLLEQIRAMSEEFIELIPEGISDEQFQNQYLANLNSIVYSFENSVMNSAMSHFDKQQLITFSTSISLSSPSALQEAYNWAITTDYANAIGKVQGWFKRWIKAVVVGLITIVGTAVGIVAAVAIGTVCPACFVPAVVALPTAGFIYGYELGCTMFDGTCP